MLWAIFCVFWNKIPCGKCSQFCSETWRHRLTLFFCSNVKFARRDIGESVRYLLNKKFDCLWNCRYWSDRAQNLPGSAINIWLTMFQISSKSVRFRRRYSRTRERRSFEFWPIQYLHDSPRIHSSRIIIVHNIAQFLSTCESHKCC